MTQHEAPQAPTPTPGLAVCYPVPLEIHQAILGEDEPVRHPRPADFKIGPDPDAPLPRVGGAR